MEKTYSIQGFEGSFHEEAVHRYFDHPVGVHYCNTFKQTFKATQSGKINGAVIAIENSIAGSILPNYSLLQKSNLFIVGEIYLKIKQQLLANPGIQLSGIKEVHSHPIALLQCSDFLEKHHFKLVETEDTAGSARFIKQHRCKHIAAIAGSLAAKQNNLNILVPDIHTDKNNRTRFLIVEKNENDWEASYNKASIYFQTNHTIGSLSKVLGLIAAAKINLSKLQSFPVTGSNFKYYFYADLEFEKISQFQKIQKPVRNHTIEYKILGIYKNGING
jgi:prephenate dehydratase